MHNRAGYRSFLLRVWRRDDSPEWLASLEDTRTGERQGFASIAEAWSFLDAELQHKPGARAGTSLTERQGNRAE